jgi:hypothetical protein
LNRGLDHQVGIEARFPCHLTRRAQQAMEQLSSTTSLAWRVSMSRCSPVAPAASKAGASGRNPRTAALARGTQGCLQMQSPPLGSVETRSHSVLRKRPTFQSAFDQTLFTFEPCVARVTYAPPSDQRNQRGQAKTSQNQWQAPNQAGNFATLEGVSRSLQRVNAGQGVHGGDKRRR